MAPIVLTTSQTVIPKGNTLYQGSASEEPGVGLDIPLIATSNKKELDLFDVAEEIAFRAEPYFSSSTLDNSRRIHLPAPIALGTPRVYEMRPNPPARERARVLDLRASDAWWQKYKPLFEDYIKNYDTVSLADLTSNDVNQDALTARTAEMETMLTELREAARATASSRGYPFFTLRWDRGDVDRSEPLLYMTAPDSVKVVSETPVGVLPGMKEMPTPEDLVLYHGGARKYGAVELDHRPTADGESLEPLPYLRYSSAIWATNTFRDAQNYSEAGNFRRSLQNLDGEQQVYYLDAAGAVIGELQTGKLNRRQANAVIEHLMESDQWKDARPDVLRLNRLSGGTEYFIPVGYTPKIVRVTKPGGGYGAEPSFRLPLPPVATGPTAFASPSDNFCRVMLANARDNYESAKKAIPVSSRKKLRETYKQELVYWAERCEESKPIAGRQEVDDAISRLEELIQTGSDHYGEEPQPLTEANREITKARLAYWKAYRANLEKTPTGYRLKDPGVLAKPEIKLLESVYGKTAAPKAVKKAATKPKKASGKAAGGKKATAGGVAPKTPAGKAVAVKKAVKGPVKPKAAPAGAPPPKRRRKPKEPVIAGKLPTVTLSKN